MKVLILSFLMMSFAFADNHGEIGKVLVVKGDAFIKGVEQPLALGSPVKSGDTLVTKSSTLLKVRFIDNTLVSMGPNSVFKVREFKINEGKRTSIYNFLRGKVRAHVKEKRKEGEKIIFSNTEVALGVRGTEILANSYMVQNAASTDVMLTRGAVNMNLSKLGTSVESYNLTPGKAFNSNMVREQGIGSVKSISPKNLELISQSDEFLPSLQNADGSFANIDNEISKAHGEEVADEMEDKAEKRPEPKKPVAKKADTTVKGLVAGGFKYILKNEPWDIRDAVMNRKKYRKENKCFYYFYKTIPGSGEFERFRRERDCDEFENELD